MKQYFYNIYFVFIFISFIFSGCYNERDVSSFDNMTESSEVVYKSNIDNSSYNIQSFSETFMTKLRQFDLQLEELICDSYNELDTNFNLNNRLKYLSKYDNTDIDKIYYWHIIGEEKYGKFVIDTKTNTAMLSKIISRKEQYKITQDEYNNICKGKVK